MYLKEKNNRENQWNEDLTVWKDIQNYQPLTILRKKKRRKRSKNFIFLDEGKINIFPHMGHQEKTNKIYHKENTELIKVTGSQDIDSATNTKHLHNLENIPV